MIIAWHPVIIKYTIQKPNMSYRDDQSGLPRPLKTAPSDPTIVKKWSLLIINEPYDLNVLAIKRP